LAPFLGAAMLAPAFMINESFHWARPPPSGRGRGLP
jgi:hypothetical protein